jgi:hypothetical protein
MNYIAEETCKGNILPEEESPFAAEGTKAHDYAERVLTGEIQPSDVPGEFWEHLEGYVSLANDIAADMGEGALVMNEQLVPLFYSPDNAGTLDYGVVSANGSRVSILDLKYGVGVYVPAEDNTQLAIYALSLMADMEKTKGFKFEPTTEITIYIYQPRHREFKGIPERWSMTYRDLTKLSVDIHRDYIQSVVADSTSRTASTEACRWCQARVICPTRNQNMFEMIPTSVNPLVPTNHVVQSLPDLRTLTDNARVGILKHHKEIIKWLNDVVADSINSIESGKAIEGLKTVDSKRGNRKWDEDLDTRLFRKFKADDIYQARKLLSPTAMKKMMHDKGQPFDGQTARFQNQFDSFVSQSPPKPVLAVSSDPKPSRHIEAVAFEVIEAEEVTEADCF